MPPLNPREQKAALLALVRCPGPFFICGRCSRLGRVSDMCLSSINRLYIIVIFGVAVLTFGKHSELSPSR